MRDTREPNKLHRYSPRLVPNAKTGRNDFEGMASFPDGKYVLFADYDQLRRQLAEAEAYADRCTEANRQAELDNDELRAKLALAEQDSKRLRGTFTVMSAEMRQWAAEAFARGATNYAPVIIGWADRMGSAAIAAGEGES